MHILFALLASLALLVPGTGVVASGLMNRDADPGSSWSQDAPDADWDDFGGHLDRDDAFEFDFDDESGELDFRGRGFDHDEIRQNRDGQGSQTPDAQDQNGTDAQRDQSAQGDKDSGAQSQDGTDAQQNDQNGQSQNGQSQNGRGNGAGGQGKNGIPLPDQSQSSGARSDA